MNSSVHREAVANRKLGDVPGFKWHTWECIGPDAIQFTGAVVVGTIEKGPREGRPKFSKDTRCVVVTESEEITEYLRYEAETGKCGDCRGSGQVFASWHHIDGARYRECRKCHGSGVLEPA